MTATDRTVAALTICTLLPLIALSAILLSVYAQRLRGNTPHRETYLLFAGWLVADVLAACAIYTAARGDSGLGIAEALILREPAAIRYTYQILAPTSIQLVRVALLMMYRGIFATVLFKRTVDVLFIVSGAHLATMLAGYTALFVLYPKDSDSPINTRAYSLANSAISMAFDAVTLSLPATAIRGLRLERRAKLGLIATFGLGGVCVAASAARTACFAEFLRVEDVSRAVEVIFRVNIMAIVEPYVSIVAACLPLCTTMLRSGGLRRTGASRVGLSSEKGGEKATLESSKDESLKQ